MISGDPLRASALGSSSALRAAAEALRSGNLAGAEQSLRDHLLQHPFDLVSLTRLAAVLRDQNKLDESVKLLRRAAGNANSPPEIRLELARVLQQQKDPAAALAEVEKLPPAVRSQFDVQAFEASLLDALGRYEQQAGIYESMLREQPKNSQLWANLGNARKYTGRAEEAVAAFRRSVRAEPTYGEGWWSLANLKTARFEATDVTTIRRALKGKLTATDAFHLHFALGKALEDQGDYEESFRHYDEGNRIRSQSFSAEQLNLDRLAEHVDGVTATFNVEMLSAKAGNPSRDPIFVLGLQRSGSTLIEQILASHSQIEGTGELDAMLHIWSELHHSAARAGRSVWDEIRQLKSEQLNSLGTQYLERTRPFRTTDKPLFVDKRPANWMYVGLIRRILPNATIIDARRHPMACGFSNFKQHYAGGAPYSYSLPLIGRFYSEYLRLMEHFDEVAPGLVLHILNEVLIEQPEGEIRRLLDHVGIPFEQSCLESHRTKRTVRSASAEQVRQPISRLGVDHWRHYEPWLDPLKEALGPALNGWNKVP